MSGMSDLLKIHFILLNEIFLLPIPLNRTLHMDPISSGGGADGLGGGVSASRQQMASFYLYGNRQGCIDTVGQARQL